jgi:hypothetical protein
MLMGEKNNGKIQIICINKWGAGFGVDLWFTPALICWGAFCLLLEEAGKKENFYLLVNF